MSGVRSGLHVVERKRVGRAWLWAAALTVATLVPLVAHAQGTPIERGLLWLRSVQQADATWFGDSRLVARDTAEAIKSLSLFAPADPAISRGVGALLTAPARSIDLEARRLVATRILVPEVILSLQLLDLSRARARDGGWGVMAGFEAGDALDTALAIRALLGTAALSSNDLVAAVNRLGLLQNADGGFARSDGEPSNLATSAEVLLTLNAVSRVASVETLRQPLVTFLLATQRVDGGFAALAGGVESDVATTALTMRALMDAGAGIATVYPPVRDFLLANQLMDGSWQGDPYATALALLVLGDARPDLMVATTKVTPTLVSRGTPATLAVDVANVGLAASPATTLSIYTGDPAAGGTIYQTLLVPALAAGAMTQVSTTFDTTLFFDTSVAFYAVVDAAGLIAEISESNNRGVVVMTLRSGSAPQGTDNPPVITSVAPTRADVGTTYTYQVEAHDPDNGPPLWYRLIVPPAGMNVDFSTGLITWPVNVPAGTRVIVTVAAIQPNYIGVAQGIAIDVMEPGAKRPPQFVTFPSSAGKVAQPYLYAARATDPDGGPVTLSLADGPPGLTLAAATGLVSWTPTAADVGERSVRLVAQDAEGASVSQQWLIMVEPEPAQKPDLVALKVDASDSPTDPQALSRGGAVKVSVLNQGHVASPAFAVWVFEDRDADGVFSSSRDLVLGRAQSAGLAKDATIEIAVAVAATALFRDNRVHVFVDPDGVVDELREDNNTYVSGREKRFAPVPGGFSAALKWEWNGAPAWEAQLVSTPMVAQLNDDNGDGHAGPGDIPDIVATSRLGYMHAFNGKTGAIMWTFYPVREFTRPAIADVDGDGFPEIYVRGGEQPNHVIALNHDGTRRWTGAPLPFTYGGGSYVSASGPGAIALHDLDGDGTSEIVYGTAILNSDGTLRCNLPPGPYGGGSDEPVADVADVDLDGQFEILSGNRLYRTDCTKIWGVDSAPGYGNASHAVGNLDADPKAEIVLSGGLTGQGGLPVAVGLHVLEHTGKVKWSRILPGGSSYAGPPSIGDIDGDGASEIVVADRISLTAWEGDGTMRWVNSTVTLGGSSAPALADLDGDGKLEVIYGDDSLLRIFRGSDGVELFSYANPGGWPGEMPVVADVDGDGRLDVAVSSGGSFNLGPVAGIRVFGGPNWAPGRSLWNQWSYHVTNIRDDQTIPAHERPSWQTHNTYRGQAPVPQGLCDELRCGNGSPDLTASFIRVDRAACPTRQTYSVRVGNGGERAVPAGARVRFEKLLAGVTTVLGDMLTTKSLAPGEFEDVRLVAAGEAAQMSLLVTVDPDQAVADGKRDNNVHSFDLVPCGNVDNRPPVFVTVAPTVAQVGADYVYFPRATDPDGDAVTVRATTVPAGMIGPSDTGPLAWRPTAQQLGPQRVSLEAADGRGGLAVQEWLVQVGAPPLTTQQPPPVPEIALSITADRASYGPQQAVALTSRLQNLAVAGRAGSLRIEITDAGGMTIATVLPPTQTLFTGSGVRTDNGTFNTGVILPGSYRAVAIYSEGAGQSRSEAAFDVTGTGTLVAGLVTDRLIYGANETVRITADLKNSATTGSLLGLTPKVQVLDVMSGVLQEISFGALDLGPAGTHRRELLFATAMRPPGSYRARLEVRQGGGLLTTIDKTFTIAGSSARGLALGGDVVAVPAVVALGSTFQLQASVANVGNSALAGLDARLQVIDAQSLATVRDLPQTIDLALGENRALTASFSSAGLSPKPYMARLEVTGGGRTLLSVASQLVVDAGQVPTVTIDVPACGSADVTPVITTQGVPPLQVTLVLDGLPYDGSAVTLEGSHVLMVTAIDGVGRSVSTGATFVIDRTRPTITVAGVTDGAAYNAEVTPTVTATDPNPASSTLTLNGMPYVSGTPITGEGVYVLVATATDCAGNQQVTTVSFRLDFGAPVVAINVAACSAAAAVTPIVTVIEPNVAMDVRLLDGAIWDGSSVSVEGTHVLAVAVTDTAGNTTTRMASFVIDRTQPAIVVMGVTDGAAYMTPVTPSVAITDANLVSSSLLFDGSPYMSETTIGTEGAHALLASGADCAGNTATSTTSFRLDFTAPVVTINVAACTAAASVTPVVTVTEANLATDVRTLDGAPYTGGPITVEGSHVLTVAVTDTAGNSTTNSATFVIDRTKPSITVAGVIDGAAYTTPVTPAVTFNDNNLASGSLLLDGSPYLSETVVGSEGVHALQATATDCAGNTASGTTSFRLDFTAPVVTISAPACTAAASVTPVVTVTEASVATDVRTLDGAPYGGGPVTAEGSHVLAVVVTDTAGNTTSRSASFAIDRTNPTITLGGVTNGAAYATPVTPTATFADANLTSSTLTLDGAPFTSGATVMSDGAYVLAAAASDCAGNNATATATFVIDRTAPVIAIDVPACSAGPTTPSVAITEANPATDVRTLDGAPYMGTPITAEGSHALHVAVTDRAGNGATKDQPFLIDATLPVVNITGVTDGATYPGAVTPVVTVTDANLSATTITLNGAPLISGATISAMGAYTLAVTATDCATNRKTLTINFQIQATPGLSGELTHALSSRGRVLIASECSGCPPTPTLLRQVLSDNGIYFEHANGRIDWQAKLRSGRFNQVILFNPSPSENGTAFKELNEAVWLGDGLIFIKDHPDAMPSLRESLGLDFGGNVPHISSITLSAPLTPATVTAIGDAVNLNLSGAAAKGVIGNKTVAALGGRGLGKALTLAWDTESSASAALYLSALAAAAPASGTPLLPGGTVDVRATARNTGNASAAFDVTHVLGAGVTSTDPLTHVLTLAAGASGGFFLTLRLPAFGGTFEITGTLRAGAALLDTDVFSFTAPRSASQIGDDAVNALLGLSLTGGQASKRSQAITSVQNAAASSSPATAIGEVLAAIDRVRGITAADVTAIRIDLARLLRTYQMRWLP